MVKSIQMQTEHNAKKRIFIIDDDKVFLNELTVLLHESGYDVYHFSDGIFMLEALNKIRPDIILIDLNMNHISGFQLADKLRIDGKTQNIPLIVMTGAYSTNNFILVKSLCGASRCIEKTIDPEELLEVISDTISKKTPVGSIEPD